jgi:hypothetical protein
VRRPPIPIKRAYAALGISTYLEATPPTPVPASTVTLPFGRTWAKNGALEFSDPQHVPAHCLQVSAALAKSPARILPWAPARPSSTSK